MTSEAPTYRQPTKDAARRKAIRRAVKLVTSRRDEAAIVRHDHPDRVRKALLKSGNPVDRSAAQACAASDLTSWRNFRNRTIGTRRPDEITVAYLAGPEPTNDLEVLLELGIRPENIWAFETQSGAVMSLVVV